MGRPVSDEILQRVALDTIDFSINHPLLNLGTRNFLSVALWKIRCGRVQRNDAEVDFPFSPILGEWADWVATASWSACGEAERSCRFGRERTRGREGEGTRGREVGRPRSSLPRPADEKRWQATRTPRPRGLSTRPTASRQRLGVRAAKQKRSCRFGGERAGGRAGEKFVATSGGRKAVASHTHSKTSRTPHGADGVATASWSACGEAEADEQSRGRWRCGYRKCVQNGYLRFLSSPSI